MPEEQSIIGKTDQELIAEYQSGREEAFSILVQRHLNSLYSFLRRYVPENDDLEDVIQDAFVKVWRNLKKFDGHRPFRPWLFSIGRNTALDWLKKKRPMAFSQFENDDGGNDFSESLADPAPLASDVIESQRLGEKASKALDLLPPRYQTVLHLRYREDMSFEEISTILEKPLETVRSQHRRGLAKLKELLEN